MRQVFTNLDNPLYYIAYAGGFACGTYLGMVIEERIAIGFEVIRVITKKDASVLIQELMKKNYGVTSMPAQGAAGKVHVLFTIVKRADAPKVVDLIRRFNPRAFYTVESIQSVKEGIFPGVNVKKK